MKINKILLCFNILGVISFNSSAGEMEWYTQQKIKALTILEKGVKLAEFVSRKEMITRDRSYRRLQEKELATRLNYLLDEDNYPQIAPNIYFHDEAAKQHIIDAFDDLKDTSDTEKLQRINDILKLMYEFNSSFQQPLIILVKWQWQDIMPPVNAEQFELSPYLERLEESREKIMKKEHRRR